MSRVKVIYRVEFIYFNTKTDETFKPKKSTCETTLRKDFSIVQCSNALKFVLTALNYMYYIVYFKKVLSYKPKDNLNDILQFFNLFK